MTTFKVFKYPVLIKEYHLDTFMHVNHAKYLELLEEARWEFLNAHGLDLKTIHETQVGPVVLECNIKYLKELRLRQSIVIESQMVSFDKKIGVMQQKILDEEGELYAQATLTFGIFDMKTRRLIRPEGQWLFITGDT